MQFNDFTDDTEDALFTPAERAAAADAVTCNDVPPQASGRGGGGQEEQVRESKCTKPLLASFFFFLFLITNLKSLV